ncbi:MAG: GH3 auxin-responsive promoter family protein, partial [Dehalococcoidales bacterium]|nr:GH3 auxin-responsive promoter family protein [Dehalococcoidales bacterium]
MTGQQLDVNVFLKKGSPAQNIKYPVVKAENDRVWLKYCGFLDLDLPQFMSIQESLLLQQLEKVARCPLGKRLIGNRTPASVEEYRQMVPLTTYEDYLPELDPGDVPSLPEEPHVWASTSGAAGGCRRVPYTLEAYHRSLDNLMSAFILACSRQRGRSSLVEGDRVLYNVAPAPYLSGILASGASKLFNLRPVMSPDIHDGMDFREKITRGFEMSLRTGVDIMVAMTSVLVKTGNEFNQMSRKSKVSKHLMHPGELMRVLRAFLRSRLENRSVLPKDLWPVKALIGWGIDTSVYRDLVYKYWGAYPYEFHACTEAGIIAV